MRRPLTLELASGTILAPLLVTLAGTVAAVLAQTTPPRGDDRLAIEVVSLIGTLGATGGVIWLLVSRGLRLLGERLSADRQRAEAAQATMVALFTGQIAALQGQLAEVQRQQQVDETGREQRHRDDIAFYREALRAERERADRCFVPLPKPT